MGLVFLVVIIMPVLLEVVIRTARDGHAFMTKNGKYIFMDIILSCDSFANVTQDMA